jgi:hypothetical protein
MNGSFTFACQLGHNLYVTRLYPCLHLCLLAYSIISRDQKAGTADLQNVTSASQEEWDCAPVESERLMHHPIA